MTDELIINQSINEIVVNNHAPEVIISEVGIQGIPGPVAPVPVSLFSYTYNQQTSAKTWNINHNLNYRPGVFAIDYGGNIMEGDIVHIDANNVQLNFSIPVTGYAYLS
jgi:hypothetical protein